jgi:hypothetical protein
MTDAENMEENLFIESLSFKLDSDMDASKAHYWLEKSIVQKLKERGVSLKYAKDYAARRTEYILISMMKNLYKQEDKVEVIDLANE